MAGTPGATFPFGPGVLKLGSTGTQVDFSCLVNNLTIVPAKAQDDPTTKLCGTVKAGAVTYTYTMKGNVDLDLADPAGLWAQSQLHAGTQMAYTFTPSTAAAATATGFLVIDPLPFGGDEYGKIMAADFEFSLVGEPSYTVAGTVLPANEFAAPMWGEAAVELEQPTTEDVAA